MKSDPVIQSDEKNEQKAELIKIPYVVYEAEASRSERHIKRLWIALIVAISMIFASNALWITYFSTYDRISYEQEGEEINNVNYGDQGDLNNNESEIESESEEVG